ncbi:MAG: radical SAM protein [Ilumatobacteraceae bacterium]
MKARHCLAAEIIPFSWVDGPGNRFVLFLQGCNFDCLACHNPQTIPLHTPRTTEFTVEEILARIKKSMPYISGITISGGEPTLQHEFILELFSAIKDTNDLRHLSTFIDSNGNATQETWQSLEPVTDGVMLDLKAFNDEHHRELTGHSNTVVLNSIQHLAKQGLLYEVRLLLVPGQNDSDQDLRVTAQWLLNVDPAIRIKINSFRSHGVRTTAREWPEVSDENLGRCRSILLSQGVRELA